MFAMKQIPIVIFSSLMLNSSISSVLEISLDEQKSNKGEIALVIFKSEDGFPDNVKKAVFKDFISINKFPYSLDLPEGDYAVSLFHDENGNKKLDTNFLNIPKEAFGFSNDALGIMGPPSFSNAKIHMVNNQRIKNKINIKLKQF